MRHTHRIAKLAGVGSLATLAIPGHATIFDRDDRQYVRPAPGSPYPPIGLVRQGVFIERRATGFLVDGCHVLTAQAVFGRAPLGRRLKFETAFGTPQHETTKATVVATGGEHLGRKRGPDEQFAKGGRDWLLLRLDKCLGDRFGHVTLKTGPYSPYEFGHLKSAGFPDHRDKENGLTVDPSCRITWRWGTVWLNDCATVRGDAGDPIFRIADSGQLEVYAMQSAASSSKRKAVPLLPMHENHAVPMSLVAPQIAPYLSASGPRQASQQLLASQ